jgi:hypothetical protein
VVGISNFQHLNKSSTLKKGSRTNLDVALSAVQLKKHKPETKAAVAMLVKNAKCSQLFALLAEKKQRFLSNLLVTNLYIAASAFSPANVITGRSFIVKTFPSLTAWEGFSLSWDKLYSLKPEAR